MDANTLIPALVAARKQRKPLTEEEALAELSAPRGADFVLPENDRPNAPNVPHGMTLESLAGGPAPAARPAPEPARPQGENPLGFDMGAVRETNSRPPTPQRTTIVTSNDPEFKPQALSWSQDDLAGMYERGAGPAPPTEKSAWDKAMDAAMEPPPRRPFDLTPEEKAAKAAAAEEQAAEETEEPKERRPFDLTPEEIAAKAAKAEQEEVPEGGFDEPPPPEEMEAAIRGEMNNPVEAEADPEAEEEEAYVQSPARERARARRRRNNSINFWMKRTHGRMSRQDIADMYDEGAASAAEGEDPHMAAVSNLHGADETAAAMDAEQAQREANVKRRVSQNNRAQRQGIPVGMVMAIDGIMDAQSPEDVMKATMVAASVYPQFGPMVQAVQAGQISAQQLQAAFLNSQAQFMNDREVARIRAGAGAKPDAVGQANDRALSAPFTTQGLNTAMTAARELGIPAEEIGSWVANNFNQQITQVGMDLLQGKSPGASQLATLKGIISTVTGGQLPSMEQFQSVFGGQLGREEAARLMEILYGEQGRRAGRTWGEYGAEWGDTLSDLFTWS